MLPSLCVRPSGEAETKEWALVLVDGATLNTSTSKVLSRIYDGGN